MNATAPAVDAVIDYYDSDFPAPPTVGASIQ